MSEEPLAKRRWTVDGLAVGGLALVALFILPGRLAAFRGDDTWTSESTGERLWTGESWLHQLTEAVNLYFRTGRPNALGTIEGLSAQAIFGDHQVASKLMILGLVVLASYCMYRLVTILGSSSWVGLLALLLFAGGVQFRSFHDGSLGYWGLAPIVMIFVLGSLTLFVRWLQLGGRRTMMLSILLFTAGLSMYESAYAFCLLFPAVALFNRQGRAAWRAAAPFLGIALAFVAYSYFVRRSSTVVVPGYEVGGSIWAAIRTFLIQLFTPIPGSSLFFRAYYSGFIGLGDEPTRAELLGATWRGLVTFAGVALVLRYLVHHPSTIPSPRTLLHLAIIGLLLWVLPVTLISTAAKYQTELGPGKGHISALMQVFGWAMVIAASGIASVIAASKRSRLATSLTIALIAAAVGIGATANGYVNMRVVATEAPVTQTRSLLEDSLSHGIVSDVPERSLIAFRERDMKWLTGNLAQVGLGLEALLLDKTGQRFDARMLSQTAELGCDAPPSDPPADCATPTGPIAWLHVRAKRGSGTVILAPVAGSGSASLLRGRALTLRVFTRESKVPLLVGVDGKQHAWTSRSVRWTLVEQGDGWRLFDGRLPLRSMPIASSIDDAGNALDFLNMTPDQSVRMFGTRRLLP